MSDGNKAVKSDKTPVWATLITNTSYLSGLLTLAYSLRRAGSKYPLVVLYADSFPPDGRRALDARGIPRQRVDYLQPAPGDTIDPRFRDCWTKLVVFSLTQYARVVALDADMLVRRNMDELMDVPLDGRDRLFAACHACLCNPLHLPNYPRNWTPAACAYTSPPPHLQHAPPPAELNGGLLVVQPSAALAGQIRAQLGSGDSRLQRLPFAEQSLLSGLFRGRWAVLPYRYNALKTLRWRGVHAGLWADGEVRCVHFILTPKPEAAGGVNGVEENGGNGMEMEEVDLWWGGVDRERRAKEREMECVDGW
ncbi:glycosyltransferase family 8 protein [Trichocladium antarcticum]|uniref:Glycosyltransferase family 8 protein n=1 Tax=Trichocladium antarcticum TaxID=1450529 RepID=A0AAN6ZIQ7_9PEZI|nr:glycosyltransferase family 8 protein [Trichocladium antarcticum]